MTYRFYDTAQGQFALCWDTCCQIIKSYHRASLQHRYAREVAESQSQMLNPLSWGLPDLTYLSVDWEKVRQEGVANTMSDGCRLGAVATFSSSGIDSLVRELKRMQMETRRTNALFNASLRQASSRSLAAMDRSVGSFQSIIDGAKLVRDLSGSVLIGASTATGGLTSAALMGAGAGSALKGVAKFQDSGSYGSAAIEATQSIVFSVFQTPKTVKLVVSVAADTFKGLIEGRSVGTALAEGSMNVPAAVLGESAKKLLGPLMEKVAVPVVAKVITSPPQILAKLPIEVGTKVLVDRAKKAAQTAIRAGAPKNLHAGEIVSTRRSMADAISIDDDLLLKFAVIDVSKGIGRSWW